MVPTPTQSNAGGVTPICTRQPSCPFHEVSLDTSLASPNATVVIVSTPAVYGTKWMCGPVLGESALGGGERTHPGCDVIHVEVYSNPKPDDLGPIAPAVRDGRRI